MIKRNGERVLPQQVEAALLAHPQITQACVVAGPDSKQGQVPVAFVVLKTKVDLASIEDFLKQKLDEQMMPEKSISLEQLPKTANGKVDRVKLLETFLKNAGNENEK